MLSPMAHTLAFVPFDGQVVAATLVGRRDRFIADVRLDGCGDVVKAHCTCPTARASGCEPEGFFLWRRRTPHLAPACLLGAGVNPGRMEAFVVPGARIYLTAAANPSRSLAWTWELLEWPRGPSLPPVLCGTNTQRPNVIARHLLERRLLPGLDAYAQLRGEAQLPDTRGLHRAGESRGRCDFLLTAGDGGRHWVEVKNCHLVNQEDMWGYFPDSVSERATRHMAELTECVAAGDEATVLFVVQRADVVHGVRPSDFHDPTFAQACREARAGGVSFRAVRVRMSVEGASVDADELAVDLAEYDTDPVARAWAESRAHTGWDRSFDGSNRRVANKPFPHHARAVRTSVPASTRPTSPAGRRRPLATAPASTPGPVARGRKRCRTSASREAREGELEEGMMQTPPPAGGKGRGGTAPSARRTHGTHS